MTATRDAWKAEYLSALRQHVAEKAETALEMAYDLGRQAAVEGWSVLEIVEAHDSEVANLVRELGSGAQSATVVEVGGDFLLQALAPFEMTRRGFHEAIEALRREVVARRQAELELRSQAEELARSNAELEQFAYVASHDLQEPLRMVGNYTQLLARRYRGKLDADADEFINYAVDGAKRMQNLINDLLSFSRVGTRGKPLAPVDCEEVLATALVNLQPSIAETSAHISHDPLPTVMGDDVQLGQVFQNLIGNAIRFHGDHPPRVHISAQRNGGACTLAVRDDGIGIAPEYFDRIFVLFQRLHARESYPGTGIGLAVCKKIVDRHGGRIWVESEPGRGATFYFTLPVAQEARVAA